MNELVYKLLKYDCSSECEYNIIQRLFFSDMSGGIDSVGREYSIGVDNLIVFLGC